MMKYVKSILALTVVCAIVAVLMAATNALTAPIIKKNESAAANEALLVVMPDGKNFQTVDLSAYTLPATVSEVYSEEGGGYVIKLVTSGYSSGMVIMCGIDKDGAITGAVCLSSGETLGYEKEYGNGAVGLKLDTVDSLDTIAGATKTTGGYKNALKDALNSHIILGGGSVDIRTEEEILADNLKSALPGGEGFEEIFIVESLSGIDGIYRAENGAGYVYVSGENFVGVSADGNIVSEVDETLSETVLAAHTAMAESTISEVDISAYELESNILKVYKTASGNYVFDLQAAGFGINGDDWYNPSREYIYIKLAATAEGEIISVKTTEQHETEGIGSACADKAFYSQFVGKNSENYKEIDAIGGATITTNGYKTAVGRALEAIKIMEGVN